MAAEPEQFGLIRIDRELVARALTDDFALLTKREAAQMARMSIRTIERAVARGELRLLGPRGARRILVRDLWRWLVAGGVAHG